jgi:thiosulfate/3-mercaptopyruvate sulfurtransferase
VREFTIESSALFKILSLPNLRILDARAHDEYADSHIANARHFDPGSLETNVVLPNRERVSCVVRNEEYLTKALQTVGIDQDSRIVIYDDGAGLNAARAWWLLDYCGHQQIQILNGGFRAWRDLIGIVSREAPTEITGSFLAVCDESKIADFSSIILGMGRPSIRICDSQHAEEFARGAIPHSVNVPYLRTFKMTRYPRVRTAAEIHRILGHAGIEPDHQVIFYCGNGYSAAQNYFAARNSGFQNVKLYDGSLDDWLKRGGALAPWGKVEA